jgi:hypothetical protein
MAIEDLVQKKLIAGKSPAENAKDAYQQASHKVANILAELATLLNKYRSDYYLR